jgi:F-type H+-transporting ATPase subunit alpha
MKFKVDEISSVLREEISQYQSTIDVAEVGKVLEVGDGIARLYGLSNAMAGEMVEFADGAIGQVLNLEEGSVGVAVLGNYLGIREGDEVKRTGQLLSVPCGPKMVGRVVDPLGRPARRQGRPSTRRCAARWSTRRPGIAAAPAGDRAAPDRYQGDRQHDPHRPRPARAHHRRPQNRQDRGRARYHHQPEAIPA